MLREQITDVFISHASEDKQAIAQPLAEALRAKGLTVWYDQFVLRLGDNLRQVIDSGLRTSRFGVVILSPAFFSKQWTQTELSGLLARETAGKAKILLPVWHNITFEEITRISPILADRFAATTKQGLESVVQQILDAMGWETPPVSLTTALDPAGLAQESKPKEGDSTATKEAQPQELKATVAENKPAHSGQAETLPNPATPPNSAPSPLPLRHPRPPRPRIFATLAVAILLFGLGIIGYWHFGSNSQAQPSSETANPSLTSNSGEDHSNHDNRGEQPTSQAEQVAAQERAEQLAAQQQTKQLEAQLPFLAALRERQAIGAYILSDISANFPDNLWVDQFNFDRQGSFLKGGALTEEAVRQYAGDLNSGSLLRAKDPIEVSSDEGKPTSYTIPIDYNLSQPGPDMSLLSLLWKETEVSDIEPTINRLIENSDFGFPRQNKPAQQGPLELYSITMRLSNMPYEKLAAFFDRLARLPHLLSLKKLAINIADSVARNLTVDLTLEVPVLKEEFHIPEAARQGQEILPAIPLSSKDPFRSHVRGSGLRGILCKEIDLRGIQKGATGKLNALFPWEGQIVFVVVGDRFFDGEVVQLTSDQLTVKQSLQDTPVSPRYTKTLVLSPHDN